MMCAVTRQICVENVHLAMAEHVLLAGIVQDFLFRARTEAPGF